MANSDSTTNPTSIPDGYKRCIRGEQCVNPLGCVLPETREYFSPDKTVRSGLKGKCKACLAADARVRYAADPEQHREKTRKYRTANPAYASESSKRYRQVHPNRASEDSKKWRANHPDEVRQYKRLWHAANTDRMRAKFRARYAANPARHHASSAEWRRENSDKLLAIRQRRRARKLSLPDTFTAADWQRALDYFNGCCAVCSRPLKDLFGTHKAAADHWIPLTSPNCPGTVVTNIVPLCNGRGGCNTRKQDSDPLEWLIRQYGKREASRIWKRIQAYFRWVEGQERAS